MNLKQIAFRRSRLFRNGMYPARELVALKSTHLHEIFKLMDFDMFHMICVLDADLRPVAILSEQEIIDEMLVNNQDMTMEQLLEKRSVKNSMLY